MTIWDGLVLALASAIILGTGAALLYARWRGRDMPNAMLWIVIALLALIELGAGYLALQPCRNSDPMRRCDLDAPNPPKEGCGLLVHPFRPC